MIPHNIIAFALGSLCFQAQAILSWPGDSYGLPMTKSGCPDAKGFVWLTGSRTQQTEDGSFCSDDNHFKESSCAAESQPSDRITQYFCIKDSFASAKPHKWEAGNYCIYKVGTSCPSGFEDGSLFWDDNVDLKYEILDHPVQTKEGVLPEGKYDRDTEIKFCCRGDGAASKPITLPTEKAFYLVRLGTECQEVKDMSFSMDFIQWAGDHKADHDTGLHPLHTRISRYSKVHYCYYQHEEKSSTFKTVLISVLGVIAVIIFIAIIVFIIQRFLAIKKLHALEAAENNNTDPMMGDTRNKEVSVIYKPGRGKKKPVAPSDEEKGGLLPSAPSDSSRPDSFPPSYDDVVGNQG